MALAAIPPTVALTSKMKKGQLKTTDVSGCCMRTCGVFAGRAMKKAAKASAQRRTRANNAKSAMKAETKRQKESEQMAVDVGAVV